MLYAEFNLTILPEMFCRSTSRPQPWSAGRRLVAIAEFSDGLAVMPLLIKTH
jgi:hypothetical protein